MGWSGYGIYGGDGTQTCHYKFLVLSKCAKNDDEIFDGDWLTIKGTLIPKEKRGLLTTNINKILKKMPKCKFWNEDKAIEWQMLLALFLDNKIRPPEIVLSNGVKATEYLIEECSDDFDEPYKRRLALRRFIKKAEKYK